MGQRQFAPFRRLVLKVSPVGVTTPAEMWSQQKPFGHASDVGCRLALAGVCRCNQFHSSAFLTKPPEAIGLPQDCEFPALLRAIEVFIFFVAGKCL